MTKISSCCDYCEQDGFEKDAFLFIYLMLFDFAFSGQTFILHLVLPCNFLLPPLMCVTLSLQFEDCTFEWLYWPQAHAPFKESTLKYIASLDAEQDIALLREHGWSLRSACARVFRISTMLLKKGAAAGLTPFEVGSMMCRKTLDKKSPIELMLEEAEEKMLPASNEQSFIVVLAKVMDSYVKKAKSE